MTRKSFLLGMGILLLLAGGAGATVLLLLRHEPSFYRRAAVPEGPEREALSGKFFGDVATLHQHVTNSNTWDGTFSEEQINSYLEEGFVRSQANKLALPEHITDPRLAFEEGRLRLGFRYHAGGLSPVVSIDLRVWLPQTEPNVVALEIRGIRAGALPVSAQSILERLTEAAESNGLKLSWYRYKGNPVAVVRFQSDQRTSVRLENFDLRPGKIYIKGQSLDLGERIRPPAESKS
jgi:hypothetical protein